MDDIDLITRVASRICHDLISPIGAIGNGLELMAVNPRTATPEAELVSDAAEAARASLVFFRLAFGRPAKTGQMKPEQLETMFRQKFPNLTLQVILNTGVEGLSRRNAQMLALMLLCCEGALRGGGQVTLSGGAGHLRAHASAPAVKLQDVGWALLDGKPLPDTAETPPGVQFELLSMLAARSGCTLSLEQSDSAVDLRIAPRDGSYSGL
ncbi:histidine phosphotransferase family protein [Oceanomicrobium pacificus]|uniref:Histidine phosphotransferase ChpT C-terminal domain-containing protein n=1 Tax=Oceanomicrobium pacificus TaxID=2692916 RepID=A0A6B0TNH0_9RHOB|nr:histidine phosphotransferase family protein [Oceanomicrobium pacificus]MXU66150.1 hypothetical protein [Oceanomicrobium pacificus]